MKEHSQTVSAIPGYAREFIRTSNERCSKELDFCESSIAKLDEVAMSWQSLSTTAKLDVCDGMCFYLGEVIRRNLGGCWIDPRWKNPYSPETHCYLNKVGGILTVSPHYWVKRRLLEGRSETFVSCYKSIKHKAKVIKRNRKHGQSSTSAGSAAISIDRTTSIITLMQFSSVVLGWIVCRSLTRISGGDDHGVAGFLLAHGYTLAVIPMVWAPLRIYANSSSRTPELLDKSLAAFGYISILVILGLYGWLAVAMLSSVDKIF